MNETAIFWNGVGAGVFVATLVFWSVMVVVYLSQSSRLRRSAELSKRGDELIRTGIRLVTTANSEQWEAWNAANEQWTRDLEQFKATK